MINYNDCYRLLIRNYNYIIFIWPTGDLFIGCSIFSTFPSQCRKSSKPGCWLLLPTAGPKDRCIFLGREVFVKNASIHRRMPPKPRVSKFKILPAHCSSKFTSSVLKVKTNIRKRCLCLKAKDIFLFLFFIENCSLFVFCWWLPNAVYLKIA